MQHTLISETEIIRWKNSLSPLDEYVDLFNLIEVDEGENNDEETSEETFICGVRLGGDRNGYGF